MPSTIYCSCANKNISIKQIVKQYTHTKAEEEEMRPCVWEILLKIFRKWFVNATILIVKVVRVQNGNRHLVMLSCSSLSGIMQRDSSKFKKKIITFKNPYWQINPKKTHLMKCFQLDIEIYLGLLKQATLIPIGYISFSSPPEFL